MTVYSADIEGQRSYTGKIIISCILAIIVLGGMLFKIDFIILAAPLLFAFIMLGISLNTRFNLFPIRNAELELLENDTRGFPDLRRNIDEIISKQGFIVNYQHASFRRELMVAKELRVLSLFKTNVVLEQND